jgi:hypothetical protein
MTERKVNAKRDWKAEVFLYEYYLSSQGRQCTVCLTDKQRELLLGLIQPTAWSTRWFSMSDVPIVQDQIEAFRDDLARRLIMACCGDEEPVQFRYTPDGKLQRSTDGGANWYDSPTYDPRVYSTQFPPIEGMDGSDKKCQAATGAAALVKAQMGDQLTTEMSRINLGDLILNWLRGYVDITNPFQVLITVYTNLIYALVLGALSSALTDEVYHLFACALYCKMDDTASFNNAQWIAVRTKIKTDISGIAGLFLEHLIYLLGTTGSTNLVRANPDATGDCSDCDCGYCATDWTFYGVTDVVKINGDHYTMTKLSDGSHFAFSSGNYLVGCYFAGVPTPYFLTWPVGSGSPSAVDSMTTPIWNYDTGDVAGGTMLDVVFSKYPLV